MFDNYENKLHNCIAKFIKRANKDYPDWSESHDNGEWEIGLDEFDDMCNVIFEIKRIELRVSFLFQEPEICHKLLERAKLVFMNAFKNMEIIVEGEKLPLDKYEGIPNDYIGRRSDWEWPEED